MTVHTNNHIFGANNDQFCFLNIANMSNVYIYICLCLYTMRSYWIMSHSMNMLIKHVFTVPSYTA